MKNKFTSKDVIVAALIALWLVGVIWGITRSI
jgi:hypothetical protein